MTPSRNTAVPPGSRRWPRRILPIGVAVAAFSLVSAAGASVAAPPAEASVPSSLMSHIQDGDNTTRCSMQRPLGRGWLSLSGEYDNGRKIGSFTARWETQRVTDTSSADPIQLSFGLDLDDFRSIKDRRVELVLSVTIENDLPWQSLIWLKRPFPVEPHGIIPGTGFVGEIYRPLNNSGGRGQSRFPVADLLAYAEDFDTLTWQVKRHTEFAPPSPDFPGGRLQDLQVGELDVGGLRDAWRYIHANRRALSRERLNVVGDCREMGPPQIVI